jgi:hypothetical protein
MDPGAGVSFLIRTFIKENFLNKINGYAGAFEVAIL